MSFARPKKSRLLDPTLVAVGELRTIRDQVVRTLVELQDLDERAKRLLAHVRSDDLSFSQNDVLETTKIARSINTAANSLLSSVEGTVLMKL